MTDPFASAGPVPTSYELIPELQLVRSRAWGVLTDAESVDHYGRMAADPDFQPTFRQVCDLRDVTLMDLSASAIRSLAQRSIFSPGAQRAFVAPDDAHFGVSRMLQTFFEVEGTEIGVFRTMAEAERWLGLPPGTLA